MTNANFHRTGKCSKGHVVDPNWTACPYCQAEKEAAKPQSENLKNRGSMGNVIGLKELISQVREDLAEAEKGAEGKGRLYVKEVIFEINIVAVENVSGKGGIDLKVLTLGGNLSEENRHIHKVTVKAESSGKIPELERPRTLLR